MKSSASTDAVIALEDGDPELLLAPAPGIGIPVWPLLRWPLIRELVTLELRADLVPGAPGRSVLARRALDLLSPNPRASRAARRRRDAVFVVPGARLTRGPRGLRDQLVEDHVDVFGDRALVLRDRPLPIWTGRADRPAHRATHSLDDAVLRSELAARFRPPRDADLAEVERIARALLDRVDFPLDDRARAKAVRSLLIRYRRAASARSSFARLLDRVQPRVAFVQGASYGDRAALIAAAHERGVRVAEHQHGWIGPSHASYNFGRVAALDPMRQTLPDDLLTFGDFWSESVRVPFSTVAVGKPALDARRGSADPLDARPRALAMISGVHDPDRTEAATLAVRHALPDDWELLFRPHPSERHVLATRYPGIAAHPGIAVDARADVLDTLGAVRGAIGVASTVLYEALALGCPVIVRATDTYTDLVIDASVFPHIVDDGAPLTAAVAALVRGDIPAPDADAVDHIWAPGALARFEAYVASLSTR